MASKDKVGITKIRKKINKELQKTSSRIESLIGEALRQIEGLQQQIQEPVKKLITDLEKIREREMKRFHDEFDRRMTELHDAQSMLMERIGLSSSSVQDDVKRLATDDQEVSTTGSGANPPATSESTKSDPAQKRSGGTGRASGTAKTASGTARASSTVRKNTSTAGTTASKSAPSRTARGATASSTGSATTKSAAQSATTRSATTSATAKKSASASKAASTASSKTGELGRIKGIGPATASKLKDKGITRVQQIANPSDAEQKALEQIANAKTRSNWQRDARSQVAGSNKP